VPTPTSTAAGTCTVALHLGHLTLLPAR
jgi:hypothetical protein